MNCVSCGTRHLSTGHLCPGCIEAKNRGTGRTLSIALWALGAAVGSGQPVNFLDHFPGPSGQESLRRTIADVARALGLVVEVKPGRHYSVDLKVLPYKSKSYQYPVLTAVEAASQREDDSGERTFKALSKLNKKPVKSSNSKKAKKK